MKVLHFLCLCGAVATLLAAAGARVSAADNAPSYGPNPTIPEPQESLLPTFKWSVDGHWPEGATPSAGQGLAVAPYAQDLKHPRWLYVLPNGDVLVAEAATVPSNPKSITGLVQGWLQRRTGSITENANRITLLRDADGDGQVETRTNFLEGLNQPFGMALINDQLYVANTDSVVRFPYHAGDTRIAAEGVKVMDLPVGHHWTRNLLASQDGSALYVTVGSGSNVAENGIDKEERRAAILKLDIATGKETLFASGLRNPNGMAFEPKSGALWTVVNERDMLGDDTPPDYLTSVKEGGFYGWPYSYWGQHVDTRVKPPRPDLVEKAIVPDYALGAHTASLGLVYNANALSPQYRGGMFISQHGSWNRSTYSGYKVIFVPFKDGSPQGQPIDVLTGFLKPDGNGTTFGRPVGLAFDRTGGLLVADDTGSTIWRVTAKAEQSGLSARELKVQVRIDQMNHRKARTLVENFEEKAHMIADEERRIQAEADKKERSKPQTAPSKPMQARDREYPSKFPAQHLQKPGLEADLKAPPMYEAPGYHGSEKLKDMVAIITGGDSGIGRAVAVLFAREGADVAIVYLDEHEDAEDTKRAVEKEGRKCIAIPGDVSDPDFCDSVVEKTLAEFGRLDILVNNAAYQQHMTDLLDISNEQFDRTMKTNLYGYFHMAKAAVPHMKPGSSIIMTGSVTGILGSKNLLDYSMTKGGIHAFARSLATHLVDRGIRVNAIAPGPVWTPLNPADRPAEKVKDFGADTPMKRAAQPEEIAPAFVFMAAPCCSSYITGEVLPIIGGYNG